MRKKKRLILSLTSCGATVVSLFCHTSVTHSPTVCVFGFRGVIRVDVNIQDVDLDQCATGEGWFADTHQCNRTTMEVNTV